MKDKKSNWSQNWDQEARISSQFVEDNVSRNQQLELLILSEGKLIINQNKIGIS